MGLAVILALILTALLGPFIVPYPEDATGTLHVERKLQPPSRQHLFGTDHVGRDIFSRVVLATGLAIQTPVIVLTLAGLSGLALGAIAGFVGGLVDEVVMRSTDVFLTIPDLVLAIAIAALLGPGIRNAFLALSLVWWPGYCRLMRGQVLAIRDEDYVQAARSMGGGTGWIILRHILPNCSTEILVKVTMDVGFVLLAAAAQPVGPCPPPESSYSYAGTAVGSNASSATGTGQSWRRSCVGRGGDAIRWQAHPAGLRCAG